MRLSTEKIENLKESITTILPNSKIYLFGSRVDDFKKGGDIDILIVADRRLDFREKAKIERNFFEKFGEQKLDLISFEYNTDNAFKSVALQEAIRL
jgi:predicted nucleotidyltransferase